MRRPSPLQNRSAPDGTLHAVAARGTLMGNRGGRLHRADATLGAARWRSHAWIACLTAFRGRQRTVWGDSYSEIFFLDEATALAAGHRPCFECRRADALAFADAWGRAAGTGPPSAPAMDRALHAERIARHEPVALGALPEAAIFMLHNGLFLRTADGARRWDFAGYRPEQPLDAATTVRAVTPGSIRAALAAGYRPRLHPTAQ